MAMKWTDDQAKVITTRNQNILVSAAAGSGKTAVLVARIMGLLTDPVRKINIDELLIVTFTRAAAAEMRTRIEAAIQTARAENPDDEHLAKQAALVHNAQITTIDGFCTYVLRNYGYTTGIVPGFRVADTGENKLLMHDVLKEVIEEAYAEADAADAAPGNESKTGTAASMSEPASVEDRTAAAQSDISPADFYLFTETFAKGKTDDQIEEAILKVYFTAVSDPDPEGWIEKCQKKNRESFGESSAASDAEGYLRDVRDEIEIILSYAVSNLKLAQSAGGPSAYEACARTDLEQVQKIAACREYEEYRKALAGAAFGRLSTAKPKPGEDPDLRAVFKAKRDRIKKVVNETLPVYFPCGFELAMEAMQKAALPIDVLLVLTKRFMRAFSEAKLKKNLMDFSDIEHEALKILRGPEGRTAAAKELAEHFAEVMVDEYQDSNYLQEAILTAVSKMEDGQGNYFCVGDVKQSIYSFRQARPELFMEKFHRYKEIPEDGLRIDLHKNFRSGGEVIDSVNAIFRALMTEAVGGIEYDDDASLVQGAPYPADPNCTTELMPVFYGEEDPEGEAFLEDQTKSGKMDAEIRAIGTRIREMVGHEEIWDAKAEAMRPIEFRDIVILVRTAKGYSDRAVRLLGEMQIPAYSESKTGYFSAMEVQTVLSFLEIVDNPQQDVPFAGVCRSAFLGISAEELAMIRAGAQKSESQSKVLCSLYDASRIYVERGENAALRGRLEAFFDWYDEIREAVPDTPLHELIDRILSESGYRDYASALPGGAQRSVNLKMLVDQASAYEKSSYIGLFNFIRYIRNLEKQEYDLGELGTISENENVVRIYTIHKSKGLEFPVVFAANLDHRFNMTDVRSFLLVHPELGVATDYIDLENRVKMPTVRAGVLRSKLKRDLIGEELRVLYVALTRAKQKLILVGCVKDEEKMSEGALFADSRELHLPEGFILKAADAFSWLIAAFDKISKETARKNGKELIRLLPAAPSALAAIETGAAVRKEDLLEQMLGLPRGSVQDPLMHDLIEERFTYQYPYAGRESIPVELSVSAIKKEAYEFLMAERAQNESVIPEPVYLCADEGREHFEEEQPLMHGGQEPLPAGIALDIAGASAAAVSAPERKRLTGAERGTAYHNLMALLDFVKVEHLQKKELYDEIQREKEALCKDGKMLPEEIDCIRNRDIALFIRSELGQRMCRAAARGELVREQPFVMAMPAEEVRGDWPEDEEVLVQGIIDGYFFEDGEMILMDYKTDRVDSEEELVDHYRVQLELYQRALTNALASNVREIWIWSFRLHKMIKID